MYILLHYLDKNYSDFRIAYNPQKFYDKIIISEVWDSLLNKVYFFNIHQGLLNGFPGVQLILSHIQKQSV
jgi:hypothetical protein